MILWGDGTQNVGLIGTHTYSNAGSFTVTLRVVDNGGLTRETSSIVTVKVPTPPATAVRIEEVESAWRYSGKWLLNCSAPHSKAWAMTTQEPGSRAILTFEGTRVTWIAYRDDWAGIARVYIDDVFQAEIDTHVVDAYLKQVVLFTSAALTAGPHTFTVEATGSKASESHATWVWVDAADVISTKGDDAISTWTRFEETDARASSSGDWASNGSAPHSGGTAIFTQSAGDRASFSVGLK